MLGNVLPPTRRNHLRSERMSEREAAVSRALGILTAVKYICRQITQKLSHSIPCGRQGRYCSQFSFCLSSTHSSPTFPILVNGSTVPSAALNGTLTAFSPIRRQRIRKHGCPYLHRASWTQPLLCRSPLVQLGMTSHLEAAASWFFFFFLLLAHAPL